MDEKILFVLIDDDQEEYEIFQMALEQIKKPVESKHFPDCESALIHFSQGSVATPKFVFIDINLPRVKGDECLQKLQALNEFDHPCIIIYSASIPDRWKPELKRIGVDKFIEKTGNLHSLVNQIQELIEHE